MPTVDLTFGLRGYLLPADHGYSLFSAICRVIPSVHSDESVGIHPIFGIPVGNRNISLTAQSKLAFRIASEKASLFLPLSGRTLDIDGFHVHIGVPSARALHPSPVLKSRLVIISGFTTADTFLDAARRQLEELGISGDPSLIPRSLSNSVEGKKGAAASSPFIRRTLQVQGAAVVGFAMRIGGLQPVDSLKLQERGIGGRRRFGCGVFVPDRRQPG